MFVYVNVSTGQTVESGERIARLDGLARWERSEKADTPAPAPKSEPAPVQDEPTPAPRKRSRRKASE